LIRLKAHEGVSLEDLCLEGKYHHGASDLDYLRI